MGVGGIMVIRLVIDFWEIVLFSENVSYNQDLTLKSCKKY
jgi:hypothetical protein